MISQKIKVLINSVFILFISIVTINAQEYKVANGVSVSGNNSDVIDYNIPASMTPGKEYSVTISMFNNGTSVWAGNEYYYLKVYDELNDRAQTDSWGISRVELPYDIKPSDKVIFSFKVTAPYTSGVYKMKWAMVKNNEYFGEYTNNTVNVGSGNIPVVNEFNGNNSEFVSVNIPETMTAGEKYLVRLTMKNTGDVEWLPAVYNEFKISPLVESNDVTYPDWNSQSVLLSNSFLPGQTSDIEFYVTAPLKAGSYDLQWMMKKGENYFGQKSGKVIVNVISNSTVQNISKTYNANFIEQTVPSSMAFNEFCDVSITFSNTGSQTWIEGSEQLVIIDAKNSPTSLNLWNVGYLQLPKNVEAGGLVTFNFKVKPSVDGWQFFQCSMMKEDGTLFGLPSQSVEVIITKK